MQKELKLPYRVARFGSSRRMAVQSDEAPYPPEIQDVIWLLAVIVGWAVFLLPIWFVWSLF
jgi:hypothetical protein